MPLSIAAIVFWAGFLIFNLFYLNYSEILIEVEKEKKLVLADFSFIILKMYELWNRKRTVSKGLYLECWESYYTSRMDRNQIGI